MISFNSKNFFKQYVAFVITDAAGNECFFDIVPFCELTALKDFKGDYDKDYFLMIIDRDDDKYRLANRHLSSRQWRIVEIQTRFRHRDYNNGHQIMCNETGQIYNSIAEAARVISCGYAQLYNHVNEKPGFRTVKGKTFKKVVDNRTTAGYTDPNK